MSKTNIGISDQIKNTFAAARWMNAQSKVNNAVSVFAKYGLGYSRIDGIVGDISRYTKKEQGKIKAAAEIMNDYKAGYYTEKQKFSAEMAVTTGHFTPFNTSDYAQAQENVLKQVSHSAHLRASLKFLQRTVYDARLQAHPNRRILGLSAEDAQEWAANVESLWRLDKNSKEWDEANINSYPQIADLAFSYYVSINEIFVIRRAYINDENRTPGISLQIIHPYQIQSPGFYGLSCISSFLDGNSTVLVSSKSYLENMPDGHYIEHGIEYNASGQEIAIFISPATSGDSWKRIQVKNDSGFVQVLHCFIQTEPGQKRGIPEAATAYHEYANIADLELFELESARLNTVIAGAVTADSNAQPNGKTPVAELGNARWEDLANESGQSMAPYTEPGYSVRKVDGGGFILQNFTPGYQYKELNTTRPNINIPEYIEKLLEYIYPSTTGLSVVVVKQRFDNSYNASKGAIDLSWRNGIQYFQKQFEADFDRPNYCAWLNAKVAQGLVSAPGWNIKTKRLAWCDMSIISPPKPSLNPLAEAKAGKERVDNLFSNREYEAQQITGTSAEENAERIMVENEALAKARAPLNRDKLELIEAKNEGTERPDPDELSDEEKSENQEEKK